MCPRHTTATDGGSAENAGAQSVRSSCHRHSWPSLAPWHTGHPDIATPGHPWPRGIPVILTITAPARPCARRIPYILYIKKCPKRQGHNVSPQNALPCAGEHNSSSYMLSCRYWLIIFNDIRTRFKSQLFTFYFNRNNITRHKSALE